MRVLTLLVLLCGLFLQTHAQIGAEHSGLNTQAAELFAAGKYAEALPLYSQLVSLYPRDAELNYRFGTCAATLQTTIRIRTVPRKTIRN